MSIQKYAEHYYELNILMRNKVIIKLNLKILIVTTLKNLQQTVRLFTTFANKG